MPGACPWSQKCHFEGFIHRECWDVGAKVWEQLKCLWVGNLNNSSLHVYVNFLGKKFFLKDLVI